MVLIAVVVLFSFTSLAYSKDDKDFWKYGVPMRKLNSKINDALIQIDELESKIAELEGERVPGLEEDLATLHLLLLEYVNTLQEQIDEILAMLEPTPEEPDFVGTWSTGAKTVWWSDGEGNLVEVNLKIDDLVTEDTFEYYMYLQQDSEWVIITGAKGTLSVSDSDIWTSNGTHYLDLETGIWQPATFTSISQCTFSNDNNTMTVVIDVNEDGVFDSETVFNNGINFDTMVADDYTVIYYRQ